MWQFSVSWNQHLLTMFNCSLIEFLNNDTMTDCVLVAEGKAVKAHRLILCLASPYFLVIINILIIKIKFIPIFLFSILQETFSSGPPLTFAGDDHQMCILPDITFSILCEVVKFIYTGKVNIDMNNYTQFIEALTYLRINCIQGFTTDIVKYGENAQNESPNLSSKTSSTSATTLSNDSHIASVESESKFSETLSERASQVKKKSQRVAKKSKKNSKKSPTKKESTKLVQATCNHCKKSFNNKYTVKNHERYCLQNPNRIESRCDVCQAEVKQGSMTLHKKKFHNYVPNRRLSIYAAKLFKKHQQDQATKSNEAADDQLLEEKSEQEDTE